MGISNAAISEVTQLQQQVADLKSLNNAILANEEFHYGEVRSKAFEEAAERAHELSENWSKGSPAYCALNQMFDWCRDRALANAEEQADGN